jgi:hypothetical protein
MRKELYIEIGANGVYISRDLFLSFDVGVFGDKALMLEALETQPSFVKEVRNQIQGFFPPSVILVANTPRTIIRAEILINTKEKLTQKAMWELVKKTFPLGRAINEETHVFDGYVHASGEVSTFFMAALPTGLADMITYFGAALVGNERKLSRLDTVENIMFKRFFVKENNGTKWVIFPQEDGLRVLVQVSGKPLAVYYLPIMPDIREGALLRIMEADAPGLVVLLVRPDFAGFWDGNETWLTEFFKANGTAIRFAKF